MSVVLKSMVCPKVRTAEVRAANGLATPVNCMRAQLIFSYGVRASLSNWSLCLFLMALGFELTAGPLRIAQRSFSLSSLAKKKKEKAQPT